MEAEPNRLAAAACRGDKTALVSLIELFYPRIYGFLRRLTVNDSDAADLTQVTFAQFFKSLSSFAGRSSFASWLHGIAYHKYVDWRRADHRSDSQSAEWWAALPSHSVGPDELVARSDTAQSIYSLVDQLESDLRDTVHLHYYQELTLEETAETMGVATSTVKYRLKQALAVLERQLQGERLASRTATPPRSK
jgi:RNA polymerase sigma-70 factor (ECF subfamily)